MEGESAKSPTELMHDSEREEIIRFLQDNIGWVNYYVLVLIGEFDKVRARKPTQGVTIQGEPLKVRRRDTGEEEVFGYIDLTSSMTLTPVAQSEFPQFKKWSLSESEGEAWMIFNYEVFPRISIPDQTIQLVNQYKQYGLSGDGCSWIVITKTPNMQKPFKDHDITLIEFETLQKAIAEMKKKTDENLKKQREKSQNTSETPIKKQGSKHSQITNPGGKKASKKLAQAVQKVTKKKASKKTSVKKQKSPASKKIVQKGTKEKTPAKKTTLKKKSEMAKAKKKENTADSLKAWALKLTSKK